MIENDILARKTVTSTKKWGKKKDGFGWLYRTSVNYKCMMQTEARVVKEIYTGDVDQISDRPAIVGKTGVNPDTS